MEVLYSMLEGMRNCAGHNSFILEEMKMNNDHGILKDMANYK